MTRSLHSRVARPLALVLTSALLAACAGDPTPESVADTSSAVVELNEVVPTTNFDFTISEVNVLLANDNKYGGGFVDWVGLGVTVEHADTRIQTQPQLGGCTLGHAAAGMKLSACLDGAATQVGKPLKRTVQINDTSDRVTVAVALDNIENSNVGAINAAAAGNGTALGVVGNEIQAVGTAYGAWGAVTAGLSEKAAEAATAAATGIGAAIGIVGIGVTIAAGLLGQTQQDAVSCTGGLLRTPSPAFIATYPWGSVPFKPQDTFYPPYPGEDPGVFTGKELMEMTAQGPVTLKIPASVIWPGQLEWEDPGTCNSQHEITLTISRQWAKGPAVAAKSGDSAIAPIETELDSFYVNTKRSAVMRKYFDTTHGWRTEPIAPSSLMTTTPIASVSRTRDALDVFWADESGNLMTAYWNRNNPHWWSRQIIAASTNHVPPHAPIAAVARTAANLDVFFIGKDGALWTDWYIDGETSPYPSAALTAANVATPGTGVAVVAPTPRDMDVFFIGNGGVVWRGEWHEGPGWVRIAPLDNQPANVAPSVAGIAATARTTFNLDVFFVGNDSQLHWTTLQNGSWRPDGSALDGTWQSGPISAAIARPGANISAAVILPTMSADNPAPAPEIDVAFVAADGVTYLAKGPQASGWPSSWTPWPIAQATSTSTYFGNSYGRTALTARTIMNRDVFVQDGASRVIAGSTSGSSTWSTTNLTPARPAYSDLTAVWNNAGKTSLATYRSTGGSFAGGVQWETGAAWDTSTQWVTGDFNGDGLDDQTAISQNGAMTAITVHESNGSSFVAKPWSWGSGYRYWDAATRWLGGDFDGDGIDDLAAVSPSSIIVYSPVKGTGIPMSQSGWDTSWQWISGDFSGDGKTDIATVWNSGGHSVIAMRQSTGTSFIPSTWLADAGGWLTSTRWAAGDFTGDGKADLAGIWNNAGSTSVGVYGSTGASFNNPVQWVTNAGWDSTSKWVAGDFSGDGKADITTVWNYGGTNVMAMRQSTGGAFSLGTWLTNGGGFMPSTLWLGGAIE